MLSIIPTLFPKAPGTWLGKKKFRNNFDASDSNTDDENLRSVAKKTKLTSKKSSGQSKKSKKDFDTSDSNSDDDNSRLVAKKTKLASKKSSDKSKKSKKTSVTKNKPRSPTLSPDVFETSDSNIDDDNSRFVAKKTKLASKKPFNQSKKFKKTSVTKNKPRSQTLSPDLVMRANKEVVRKRRPINFTVDDLDDDKDESFTRNDFDTSDSNTDDEEFQNLSKMTTAQLNAVTYNKVNQSGEPSGRKRKIVNYKDFEFEKNESDEDF